MHDIAKGIIERANAHWEPSGDPHAPRMLTVSFHTALTATHDDDP